MSRQENKNHTFSDMGANSKYSQYKLSKFLDENLDIMQTIFEKDHTLVISRFINQTSTIKCAIVFIEGMVNSPMINKSIIEPMVKNTAPEQHNNVLDYLMHHVILINDTRKAFSVIEIINALVSGHTILFVDHTDEVLIMNTVGWQARSITEPDAEKTLKGPREGFTEVLITNLSLIRRKLLTPDLKFEYMRLGARSHTRICICYLDGLVNKKILKELYQRLNKIDMDGILASGYIDELISDSPLSPFKTVGFTERPDVVAAKLLEGRIAVIVDGSPVVLTLPFIFIEYFQVNEDYDANFYFTSINRILRYLGFIITISVPAIYVALITFHQELIPTHLALSIAAAKEGIPFPTLVEALALLTVFELLRETGTRMPANIGQALNIVGALVIGQAAVEARFVSAPIVIVIALSGIAGLMIPKFKSATILLRVLFVIASSILGLYGFIFGAAGLMLHLFELRSFGVPYMLGLMTISPQDIKDTLIRVPWWYMEYRPKFIAADLKRKGSGVKGNESK